MDTADAQEMPDIEVLLRAELTGKSVLLLEDEVIFAMPIVCALQEYGVEQIQHVQRGDIAAREAIARRFDVLLLDRQNPGIDGLEALRRIRASGTGSHETPALIITSKLNSETDRMRGRLGGADDYVDKTIVGTLELMARVASCIRRATPTPALPTPTGDVSELRNGPLVIKQRARRAFLFGEPLDLAAQAFDMLLAFCEHPGKAFTNQMIVEITRPHLKGRPPSSNWDSLAFKTIHVLRAVVEPFEARLPEAMRPMLMNLRGQGYVLRDLSGGE